jgi:hypothetical protein
LTERLRADGIQVVDVPAKLARRVRLLSCGHGRKSDEADALSVGIAAWSASTLHTGEVDQAIAAQSAMSVWGAPARKPSQRRARRGGGCRRGYVGVGRTLTLP